MLRCCRLSSFLGQFLVPRIIIKINKINEEKVKGVLDGEVWVSLWHPVDMCTHHKAFHF